MRFEKGFYLTTCSMGACHNQHYSSTSDVPEVGQHVVNSYSTWAWE